MDRDEMSNRYIGPPIDAFYNVTVHLAQQFQRRRFKKIGQSETRIACGGHGCLRIRTTKSIATEEFPQIFPSKFRYIWSNSFRREEFLKSANKKQQSPVAAMFVNGLGRNEQSLQRTFLRCFLPSFRSFDQTVTEEKNFLNQPIRNKSRLWRPCLLTDRDEKSNEGLPQMLPTKLQFIWLSRFRGIFICNSIHS